MNRILILAFLIAIISGLYGQASSGGFSAGSAYSYSGTMNEQDQLKIYVYIWGQVMKPGLYIVPDDIDLLSVLSLAGGPTENAKLKKIRIVRNDELGKKTIFWVDLKKYIEVEDSNVEIPVLKPGDTIIVSGTSFYAFAKVADFFSKVAITLSVYNTVKNLSK